MNPYEQVVLERISELWRWHRWYQSHLGWIVASKVEHDAELRMLLRLRREARRRFAQTDHPADAAWQAWTEGELVVGWGK